MGMVILVLIDGREIHRSLFNRSYHKSRDNLQLFVIAALRNVSAHRSSSLYYIDSLHHVLMVYYEKIIKYFKELKAASFLKRVALLKVGKNCFGTPSLYDNNEQ